MMSTRHLRTTIAVAALCFLVVSPALAQGNGKAKGKARNGAASAQVERDRPTLRRRGSGNTALPPRYEDRDDRRGARSNDRYEDRDDDRFENRDDDRFEDRDESRRRGDNASWEDILFGRDERGRRRVPPGWCQGRGNPHNTPENCGYSERRYDWDHNDRWGGYGSYSQAHTAFHRALDREYSARAAQHRADPLYQLRLRAEKAADHERWHERMGRSH